MLSLGTNVVQMKFTEVSRRLVEYTWNVEGRFCRQNSFKRRQRSGVERREGIERSYLKWLSNPRACVAFQQGAFLRRSILAWDSVRARIRCSLPGPPQAGLTLANLYSTLGSEIAGPVPKLVGRLVGLWGVQIPIVHDGVCFKAAAESCGRDASAG
jgi:hypothetical protein